MNKKNPLRDVVLLHHPIQFVFALTVGFVFMDPFQMGPIGGHDFKHVKHNIVPYKQVMESWRRDKQSMLGKHAKLEVEGEVFVLESLEFNSLRWGPYSGLADGR